MTARTSSSRFVVFLRAFLSSGFRQKSQFGILANPTTTMDAVL